MLASHKAEPIALPSAEEVKLINRFADQREQREIFRHDVAAQINRVAADLDSAVTAVAALFDSRSLALEQSLAERLEKFEPWAPSSSQPRLLARSAQVLKVTELIQSGFQGSQVHGSVGALALSEDKLRSFLSKMFWEEIKLVRDSERDLSGWELFRAIYDSSLSRYGIDGDPKVFFAANKHALIYQFRRITGELTEDGYHFIMSIDNSLVKRYNDRLVEIPKIQDFDIILNIEHYTPLIGSVEKTYRALRRKKHTKRIVDTVKKFKESISRKSFFIVPPEFQSTDTSSVEKEAFEDIIDADALSLEKKVRHLVESRIDRSGQYYNDIQMILRERLGILDELTPNARDEPISELVLRLFPRLEAALEAERVHGPRDLPNMAPGTWRTDKRDGETPPEFIQRVYGDWMGRGLTLADVRKRDEPLAQAYYHHLRKQRPLPPGFDLPTKPEQNTRWLERVQRGEPVPGATGPVDPETIRLARRLDAIDRNRRHRKAER